MLGLWVYNIELSTQPLLIQFFNNFFIYQLVTPDFPSTWHSIRPFDIYLFICHPLLLVVSVIWPSSVWIIISGFWCTLRYAVSGFVHVTHF